MPKATINGVSQYYGPRTRYEGTLGTEGTRDDERVLTVFLGGADFLAVTGAMPAGATVVNNCLVEISEAFVLGGTTPVINVGVQGSEGTNRLVQLSQAQAQTIGTYSIASAGTLAVNTPLAAVAQIRAALGGTAPTVAGVGRAKITIRYQSI